MGSSQSDLFKSLIILRIYVQVIKSLFLDNKPDN